METKELIARREYLAEQIEQQKIVVERALAQLESLAKQYLEIEYKLNPPTTTNEVQGSSLQS